MLGDNMDILMVKIENRKIIIRTSDDEVKGTMIEQIERLLQPLGFVKIDQSKLVNIYQVEKLYDNTLTFFDNDLRCHVSRRNLTNFRDKFRQI